MTNVLWKVALFFGFFTFLGIVLDPYLDFFIEQISPFSDLAAYGVGVFAQFMTESTWNFGIWAINALISIQIFFFLYRKLK